MAEVFGPGSASLLIQDRCGDASLSHVTRCDAESRATPQLRSLLVVHAIDVHR